MKFPGKGVRGTARLRLGFGLVLGLAPPTSAWAADWPEDSAWVPMAPEGVLAVSDAALDIHPDYSETLDSGLDCVGDEAGADDGGPRSALWWTADDTTHFFRIRVDEDPSDTLGTWAIYLDYDGDSTGWDFAIKATRSSPGTDRSATSVLVVPTFLAASDTPWWMLAHDPADADDVGPFDDHVRVVEADESGEWFGSGVDYFVDIQIDRSDIPSISTERSFRMAAATGGDLALDTATVDLDLCGSGLDSADGLPTGDLEDVWSGVVAIDEDRDGLFLHEELALGTDPTAADTDDDDLSDAEEVNDVGSNPTVADTDSDGLNDGTEVELGTNPLHYDTDDDGLDDGVEVTYGTDPTRQDSDGDTLTDRQEYDCNPDPDRDETDLDDDGLEDFDERSGDRDADGAPDYCDPDDDGDGLLTRDEPDCGTAHDNPDTDGDGILDGDESCTSDSDGDGTPDVLDPTDDRGTGSPLDAGAGDLDALSGGRLAGGSCSSTGRSSVPWWPLVVAMLAIGWRRRARIGVVVGGAALGTPAAAQELNAQTLVPAVGEDDFIRVNDTDVGAPGGGFTALFHHADEPLVYIHGDGTETPILETVGTLDAQAWGTFGPARVGLDLPIHTYASGFGLEENRSAVGDLVVDARVEALDRTEAPAGLAAELGVVLPTGNPDTWLGDQSAAVFVAGVASTELGKVLLSGDLGIELRSAQILPDDTSWGNRLPFAAGARWAVHDRVDVSTELTGEGFLRANNPGNAVGLEGIVSARVHPADRWSLIAGGAKGLSSGLGTPGFRLLAGVQAHFVSRDRSSPGPAPAVDAHPEHVQTHIRVLNGTTGDGVGGAVVEIKDGPDDVGRFTVPPVEGVHIPLRREISYQVLLTAPGYQDLNHFIEVPANAGAEWNTAFRMQPRGRTCTVTFMVRDLDGRPVAAKISTVPSTLDAVQTDTDTGVGTLGLRPGEAYEVIIGAEGYSPDHRAISCRADASGALVDTSREVVLRPPRARLTGDRITIADKIQFETDSDIIDDRSKGILDDVAKVLEAHPEVELVEIRGHTDSRGTDVHNLQLSGRRAQAVRAYLMAAGTAESRIRAVGLGESIPVQEGDTEAAHEANRRVEFLVVRVGPPSE